jgi:PBP1b-binding outer membrane lipoprotein LpoB
MKKFLIILAVFALLVFSGCVTDDEKNVSDQKDNLTNKDFNSANHNSGENKMPPEHHNDGDFRPEPDFNHIDTNRPIPPQREPTFEDKDNNFKPY